MRIIKRFTLEARLRHHPEARRAVEAWIAMVRAAAWTNREDLRRSATNLQHLLDGPDGVRAVFRIHHHAFRLVVGIRFAEPPSFRGIVFIKFFGTHSAYDRIDATTIEP